MMSKGDAQRALEKCNGTKIRAGVAEQLVQAKQKKKKQVRVEEKISKEKARKEQEEAEEEVAGVERVIAVDWALSKDRWEEEKAKMDVAEDAEVDEGDSDSGEGSESEEDSGSGSGSDEGEGSRSSLDDEGEEDEEPMDEEPQKPQLPAPEEGTTLFVRNIPFEATEDELRVLWVVPPQRISPGADLTAQFPHVWPAPLRPYHDGPRDGSIQGNGFCLLLER